MSLRQESFLPWLDRRTLAVGIISVAVVASTYLVVDGWKATHAGEPPAPKTFEVSGEATRHFAPDHMTWTITVHGRDSDQGEAMNKLRTAANAVHEYLIAHDISDAELTFKTPASERDTSDTTTHDENGEATTESSNGDWSATQDIEVNLKDIKRGLTAHDAEAIADDLSDADIGEATCNATVFDSLKEQLVGEARQNVRVHAKLALDQYGGAKLGHLVTANMGSVDIGSDCADIVVTASAAATYELE